MSDQTLRNNRGNRPQRNQSRVEGTDERPQRTPVSGNRDMLTVQGKDPEYEYRWVKDEAETGQRIMRFLDAGYAFVSDKDHKIGQANVYNSQNVGSIIRKPAGKNEFLYLMRIIKDWYDEDQAAKENTLAYSEQELLRPRDHKNKGDDGQYGQNTLSYKEPY